jgi:hypothetical protein
MAATSVGNFALFGGGNLSSYPRDSAIIDAYDEYLTRTTQTNLYIARGELAATSVGGYALFGGGRVIDVEYGDDGWVNIVDAYKVT